MSNACILGLLLLNLFTSVAALVYFVRRFMASRCPMPRCWRYCVDDSILCESHRAELAHALRRAHLAVKKRRARRASGL